MSGQRFTKEGALRKVGQLVQPTGALTRKLVANDEETGQVVLAQKAHGDWHVIVEWIRTKSGKIPLRQWYTKAEYQECIKELGRHTVN